MRGLHRARSPGSTFPAGAVAFAPPARYALWWRHDGGVLRSLGQSQRRPMVRDAGAVDLHRGRQDLRGHLVQHTGSYRARRERSGPTPRSCGTRCCTSCCSAPATHARRSSARVVTSCSAWANARARPAVARRHRRMPPFSPRRRSACAWISGHPRPPRRSTAAPRRSSSPSPIRAAWAPGYSSHRDSRGVRCRTRSASTSRSPAAAPTSCSRPPRNSAPASRSARTRPAAGSGMASSSPAVRCPWLVQQRHHRATHDRRGPVSV